MKYLTTFVLSLAITLVSAASFSADEQSAQYAKGYTEGPVTIETYIRILEGGFEEYIEYLRTSHQVEIATLKEAGLVIDSKVYATMANNPNEPNIIIATTYKNWAALDRRPEVEEAFALKNIGTTKQAIVDDIRSRTPYRKILGSKIRQELIMEVIE